jgi:mono/diheme cytochrome c family protein
LLGLGLLVLIGCQPKEQTSTQSGTGPNNPPPGFNQGRFNQGGFPPGFPDMTPPTPLAEKEPHAAGKKVFNANTCFRCHAVTGVEVVKRPIIDAPAVKDGQPKDGPPVMDAPPKGGPQKNGPGLDGPPKGGPPMGGPGRGGPPMGGPPMGGPPMGRPPFGGPGMGNKGPDLAKVASKAGRNVDWFIAFVNNPRKENPAGRMPPFENKIKPENMRALAEFLASLK